MSLLFENAHDQRPLYIKKINSINDEIARLEGCVKTEWAAIKDFNHSYEDTKSAEERIEKMKSNIRKFTTERKRAEKKLNALNSPSWSK